MFCIVCRKRAYRNTGLCFSHAKKWARKHLIDFTGNSYKYPKTRKELDAYIDEIEMCDMNYIDERGCNALHRAVEKNDITLAKHAITNCFINEDSNNGVALELALTNCVAFNIDMIRFLLKSGANPNYFHNKGHMSLLLSDLWSTSCIMSYKCVQTLRLLMEYGGKPRCSPIAFSWGNANDFKKGRNIIKIQDIWDTQECLIWKSSILQRFVKQILPNGDSIKQGGLVTALSETFEISTFLTLQNYSFFYSKKYKHLAY